MAGRRAIPPKPVAAASLGSTGAAATDRPLKQAEQALLDLQGQQRRASVTMTSQGDDITTLQSDVAAVTSRVTTLEGEVFGRLLAAPARLTGSGSGTVPAGTAVIRIRFCGQGGGGGGAVPTGGNAAAAGGSSGEVVEVQIGTPGTPLSVTSYSWAMGGAGGAGGTSAGTNGSAGTASTFTYNAVVYTAAGGTGGTGSTGGATGNWNPTAPTPGTPAVGTSGVLRRTYGVGTEGKSFGGAWLSGNGGACEFGAGGVLVGGNSTGNNGRGPGGGGSGAATGAGGFFGGSGIAGEAIIEFYS